MQAAASHRILPSSGRPIAVATTTAVQIQNYHRNTYQSADRL